jgi:hypothetical protein
MNNDDISVILLLGKFLHAPSITDIAPLTRVLQSSGYSSPAAYPQGGGEGGRGALQWYMYVASKKIIFYIILYYTDIHEAFYSWKNYYQDIMKSTE